MSMGLTIAGYCRISVDTELDRDNTSIENQKEIIQQYVERNFPDAQLDFFIDRDRSGYTFEQREGYQRLRPKLLDGTYKVLIVKDFSRFSRRNSLGLYELETLRDAHVRIIAIGDGIDYPTKDDWMLIQFKFLMNEMPVTDTSKKIKTVIKNRQQNGKWVCAVPYGYRIINTKEMTYEIDPPAAEVVREIFRLYNNGWGYKKIANYLTDNGVPTPRANEIAYKELNGQSTKIKSKREWSIITVSKIITNDFYIGTLRQKKYTREKINGKDKRLAEEEHIVLEKAHTPIIDNRTFAVAQEQLRLRSKSNYRGEKKYDTSYSGFLFCGDCGNPMFSMSRPDLAAAYICGTYHRRGLKGCTSHHIRVDKLDELLKRYITLVKENSAEMIEQLNNAIKDQDKKEENIGQAIETLERQLTESREQLKVLLKRKIVDSMKVPEDQQEIIEASYADLEKELLVRIGNLEKQIDRNILDRNQMLQVNRAAKTVLDVFDDILQKPKLDKSDLALIIERITVYEDHLDIQLKADIDALLGCIPAENGEEGNNSVNFNQGSKDSLPDKIVQSATHQRDKVFTVNVVNSGDPLEIFTAKDGEVIFKKYSPMGEFSNCAAHMCETLNRTTGYISAVADRDSIIAVSGAPSRELSEKRISNELERLMEDRQIYQYQKGGKLVPVAAGEDKYKLALAAPIISEGDVLGGVIFLSDSEAPESSEVEYKLAQTVAGFLGRQLAN